MPLLGSDFSLGHKEGWEKLTKPLGGRARVTVVKQLGFALFEDTHVFPVSDTWPMWRGSWAGAPGERGGRGIIRLIQNHL